MSTEKVSIIIPCFNNVAYIGEAIQSALSQTHPEIEIIVIDDGSNDGSDDIIAGFADDIISLRQENRGACIARNRGLEVASGAWIKFLDGDDVLMPDCISRQIAMAKERSVVIFGDCILLHEDGRVEPHPTHEVSSGLSKGDKASLSTFLGSPVLTSTTLYPIQIFKQFGGFDPAVQRGQEHELNLRFYGNGVEYEYQPQICYYYRQHFSPGRISVSKRRESYFRRMENFHVLVERIRTGPRCTNWDVNRQVLANSAWRNGRRLLRSGDKARALAFFQFARSLTSNDVVFGSNLYKSLVLLFGPIWAERMSTFRHHLRKCGKPAD